VRLHETEECRFSNEVLWFFTSLRLGAEYNPSFPYGNGENGVMTHQILLEEKQ
jgi:hypothetical protein